MYHLPTPCVKAQAWHEIDYKIRSNYCWRIKNEKTHDKKAQVKQKKTKTQIPFNKQLNNFTHLTD